MSIFSIFTLLGGLAFFIYGMNQMSHSLEIIAGEKMEAIINKLTSNRFLGLLLGCVITISDHCSNIAIAVLEEGKEEFSPHEYMQQVKSGNDPVFQKLFRDYQTCYLSEFSQGMMEE